MSDKSQTPTGVFVRLPLSDNEKMALTSGVKMGGSIEQDLLAIGTPVGGGELEVEGYVRPDWREGWTMASGTDCGNILSDQKLDTFSHALCDYDKAQAALAAAQAEIARKDIELDWLRDRMEVVRSYLTEATAFVAKRGALDAIEEALKGPEA